MVAMTLDHVRDYASTVRLSDPMDLAQTPGDIVFARWLSHFCAPVFVLLAGVSARFVGQRLDARQLSGYLAKRGVVLILLELTVVGFAWSFNAFYPLRFLQVIWALGVGMLALAVLVRLPARAILGVGLLVVLGHNVLDSVHVASDSPFFALWSVLYEKNVVPLGPLGALRTTYPVLPVIGLIALGYCLGGAFIDTDWRSRRRQLIAMGLSITGLFVVLRLTNLYGDPHPYNGGLVSLINTTKYPMSLAFMTMTLGPVLVGLGAAHGTTPGAWSKPLALLGRVPLFYYIVHLYVMHAALLVIAKLSGAGPLDFTASFGGMPPGFALPMSVIAAISLVIASGLLPLCAWYERLRRERGGWLRYI